MKVADWEEGWFGPRLTHGPLGTTLGKGALREVRELSWMPRDKLYILRTQVELAPGAQEPWRRSRNTTIDGLPTGV